MELIHGGDVTGYELEHGRPALDFSASLSPLGIPPAVATAAARAASGAEAYPDPLCRRLTAAVAERYGCPAGFVFCASGAADVIYRLALAVRPRRALIPVPAFAEYELAAGLAGCAAEFYPLAEENAFWLDDGILPAIRPGVDILFLCQPGNPTGWLIQTRLVDAIVERCRECGVRLVVDECFLSLTGEREKYSLVPRLAANPHVIVLDSFTKLYAMAGLRLGMALTADRELAAGLRRAGPPWAVSSPAEAAGLVALRENEYVARTLRAVDAGRRVLLDGLAGLGCRIYGSAANYIFFFSAVPDLASRLAECGILIRDCGNFRGLPPGYYRVAVRREDENRRLLGAIQDVMKEHS